jgi:heterodisulfide reductase subunit C
MGLAVAPPAVGTNDRGFLEEVSAATITASRIEMCIQCGTCGGSCPSAADMDHTPRALFALVRAGMRDSVLRSNTPWMCVSCYHCAVRCPQEIHIPDVMYALKRMALKARRNSDKVGPDFSRTFISNVERFGRSYEIGLTAVHYLKHYPLRLPGIAPMGLGMLGRGRLGFKPKRIEGIEQLHRILARARELETNA